MCGMGTTVHCLLAEDWGLPGLLPPPLGGGGSPGPGVTGVAGASGSPAGRLAHTVSLEFKYSRSSPEREV